MWSIVFYTDHRGKCPPLEFIEDLPVMGTGQNSNALRLLQEFGTDLSIPHAKPFSEETFGATTEESGCSISPTLSNNSLSCTDIENKIKS